MAMETLDALLSVPGLCAGPCWPVDEVEEESCSFVLRQLFAADQALLVQVRSYVGPYADCASLSS